MTKQRLELGKFGEDLALKELERLGYKKIVSNYNCALGEVDLIAKDGDVLVFVEIKTRKGKSIGYTKEAVNTRKMRQLSKVALYYMKSFKCFEVRARFDVVAVSLTHGNRPEIEVIKNAFELAY